MNDDQRFRRSSFCTSANCVEVARLANGSVALRDSKHPDKPPHEFTGEEWATFVRGVHAGEFDFDLPIDRPTAGARPA